MRRYLRYLQTYEGITAAIAFILSLIEVFLYKGVYFIYVHSQLILLLTSLSSIICIIITHYTHKRLINSIFTVSIVLCIVTLCISGSDFLKNKSHNKAIESALLIKEAYGIYNKIEADAIENNISLSDNILSNIIFRKDSLSTKLISDYQGKMLNRSINYCVSAHGDGGSIYFCDPMVLRESMVKDKSNTFLPDFTLYTFKGLREFEKENWSAAKKYLNNSASKNDPIGHYYLYLIYEYGFGEETNPELAKSHLEAASDNGNLNAKYTLVQKLLQNPSHLDLDIAEKLLVDIVDFKPTYSFLSGSYMDLFYSSYYQLMRIYDTFESPIKRYKQTKKLYRVHKNNPEFQEFIIIEHALNCYKCDKLKKTFKFLQRAIDLDIPLGYYYAAQVLSEHNINGEKDEQIHDLLLDASYRLNHQQSRLKLIEYYNSHNQPTLATLWKQLYDVEYSNTIIE